MQLPRLVLLTTSLLALAFGANVGLSQLVVQETISIAGTVESVSGNTLVVKDDTGKAYTVRVQSMDKESVRLAGGQFLRSPAEIIVTGSYVVDDLKAGQNIRFQCNLNRLGRTTGEVAEISLVTGNDEANGIKVIQAGNKPSDHSTCEIVAELSRVTNDRLVVKIPANNGFTRKFTLSI
ncbi:MAG: hypothetical protein L7W43_16885, partial [Rubripirellula sp.]|nr:hypothetical protein [Rubripirellula sp.]